MRLFIAIEALSGIVLLIAFLHRYRYRDLLWEAGGTQGWNSDPSLRTYFYANHQEPPEIPTIWSQG